MMKKFPFINLALALMLLFTVAFQSLHAYEHFAHDHEQNEVEIAHHLKKIQEKDHDHEKCFVCEYTLSNASIPETQTFTTVSFIDITKQPKANFPETTSYFSGSLLSHRGPPSC